MIHIDSVSFRYPGASTDALHAFSLDIPRGCLFGLLGPNGSGKTTLISLLVGLRRPDAGVITIGGATADSHGDSEQLRIALVPQDYAFYPQLSVRENLRFFAGACAVPSGARAERLRVVIEATGLAAFTRMRAQHLSGGLKRRLNLAIGLLNDPQILLLDEPTVGIDPQSRHFILDSIRRLNAAGATIVYTSHYMEEVEALCSTIGVLDQGRLIACGDLQQLLRTSRNAELVLDLVAPPDATLRQALHEFPGITVDGTFVRASHLASGELAAVLDRVLAAQAGIARLRYGQANLESLFLHLTGRQLRD